METGYIRFVNIEKGEPIVEVKIVDGTIWMTVNEIADLFGIYTLTINKHLKTIFKDNLLREKEVIKEYKYKADEGEYIRIYYNLEAIVFLSLRIQSRYTRAFRGWAFCSLCKSAQVNNTYNSFISCESIIKDYSSLNLN